MRHRMPTRRYLPVLMLAGIIILMICHKDGEKWVASNSYQPIHIDPALLQPGDLIYRKGSSMISNLVRMMDGSVNYTHVGIVAHLDGNPVIVHAVPGENPGEPDRVKIDILEDFLRPDRASAMSVYRLTREHGDSIPLQASLYALQKAIKRTPFDAGFNLSDTSRMYCTELIWRAYLENGLDICEQEFDMLSLSFGNGPYILPGRLINSPYFEPATFLFTKNKTP